MTKNIFNKLLVLLILIIPIAYALDECKGTMFTNEIPCLLLLPVNTSETACNTLTTSFYDNGSTLTYIQIMAQYTTYLCNNTFNQTDLGTHTFLYGTGDSGSIVVEEDEDQQYYLYVVVLIIFFILIGVGYHYDIDEFIMIAGILAMIIGINLFNNSFPNLINDFLKNSIVVIIWGVGAYLILAPAMKFFENWRDKE